MRSRSNVLGFGPLVDWGDCPSLYAPVHWRSLDAETPYAITDFGSLPLDMVFGAEHAVSHEGGDLENPWNRPGADVFRLTKSPTATRIIAPSNTVSSLI